MIKKLDQILLNGSVLAIAAAILTIGPMLLSPLAFGDAKLPPNSVSTGTIVDGQVTTPDLADNSVTSEKIRDGTIVQEDVRPGAIVGERGPAGPPGPKGDPGPAGPAGPTQSLKVVEVKSSSDIPAGTFNGAITNCPDGTLATGGGFDMTDVVLRPPFPIVVTEGATKDNLGWHVEFANPNTRDVTVIVKAECASLVQ